MPLKLKRVLSELEQSQSTLAGKVQLDDSRAISRTALSLIINHDTWPVITDRRSIEQQIKAFLCEHGATVSQLRGVFKADPEAEEEQATAGKRPSAKTDATPLPETTNERESTDMLLRKHTLTKEAKQHFRIPRDPFTDEMASGEDVFLSDDIRYVRAAIRQNAKHGGLLAIVGESGAGKSTLRQDLIDWIRSNREQVIVIEPYVLGLEDTELKGKMLKSASIAEAIIQTVAPHEKPRRSMEQRSKQMHELLKASAQVGNRHVVIIEEAHGLPIPTIKHLKRFYELHEGFKKLLSIILIGQTELEWKLSEHNPEVREVVQRCEIVRLNPLDNNVEAYIKHKFSRVEVNAGAIFDSSAYDEIRSRLRISHTDRSSGKAQTKTQSLCYPLAVNNVVSGAMNAAVKIGAPKVTGDLVAAALVS